MTKQNTPTNSIENADAYAPQSFVFKAGTVLSIGDHKITLIRDSELWFEEAGNESRLVGMLVTSKNLDTNRENLTKSYNGFGMEVGTPAVADETPVRELTGDLRELDPNVVPSQQGVIPVVSQSAKADGETTNKAVTQPDEKPKSPAKHTAKPKAKPAAKVETPKADAPKVETPKADAAKAEETK